MYDIYLVGALFYAVVVLTHVIQYLKTNIYSHQVLSASTSIIKIIKTINTHNTHACPTIRKAWYGNFDNKWRGQQQNRRENYKTNTPQTNIHVQSHIRVSAGSLINSGGVSSKIVKTMTKQIHFRRICVFNHSPGLVQTL